MSAHSEFEQLADRLLAGDDLAARELLQRYSARLVSLASGRLPPQVRSKLDPEDVVQSVMRSFFGRAQRGRLKFSGWEGLWGLLTLMTLRRCARHARRFSTAQRDLRREIPFDRTDDSGQFGWTLPGRDPTPDEAAELADTIEHLLSQLGEMDRGVVERTLAGHPPSDIAHELGCSLRTVQRTILRVQQFLWAMNDRSLTTADCGR